MKKSDLKTGHIVELRNGDFYVVLKDICKNNLNTDDGEGILSDGGYMPLSRYTEDMRYTKNNRYDVMAVYLPAYLPKIVYYYDNLEDYKEIWRRPEPVKKTVAELKTDYETAHNCEVEVIET